ncbi:hypothetical protein [Nocardioides kribbensis]|uniref:hypothetical protein n=1 Tax=Nocardioides kribbensis TaxID=305517 RepID=UPI00187988EA|nr:hypothetical protein [Nocardioides kribbensis]
MFNPWFGDPGAVSATWSEIAGAQGVNQLELAAPNVPTSVLNWRAGAWLNGRRYEYPDEGLPSVTVERAIRDVLSATVQTEPVIAAYWKGRRGNVPRSQTSWHDVEVGGESYSVAEVSLDKVAAAYSVSAVPSYPEWIIGADYSWSLNCDKDSPWTVIGGCKRLVNKMHSQSEVETFLIDIP